MAGSDYFRTIAEEALRSLDQVLTELFPGASPGREGPWYVLPSPFREERTPSFKVNEDGGWMDFGGSEKGGDLVALWAAVRQVPQKQAAKELAEFLRIDPEKPSTTKKRAPRAKDNDDEQLLPAPDNAPDFAPRLFWKARGDMPGLGTAVGHWVYRDAEGAILYVVARWDVPENHPMREKHGRKVYRPLTCWRSHKDGRLFWKMKGPPRGENERPIFNLNLLADADLFDPSIQAPVCIVEGEKAAEAAQRFLPGWVVTTSHNGAKGARSHDWGPLKGRTVVIWPDLDLDDEQGHNAGLEYAKVVAELLKDVAASVHLVDLQKLLDHLALPTRPTNKWDAADLDYDIAIDRNLAKALIGQEILTDPPKLSAAEKRNMQTEARPRAGFGRLVEALTSYIEQQEIVPDATTGFRDPETWALVDINIDDIIKLFLFEVRHYWDVTTSIASETLEAIILQARQRRRRKLVRDLTRDATDEEKAHGHEQVLAWVRAVTGHERELDVAVMLHFLWQTKRRALTLGVDHDLMPVIRGLQGSGKSTAVRRIVEQLNELWIPIRASAFTDAREARILSQGLVGFWDEMEGARGANLEALKFTISADQLSFRPMRTNQVVTIPRRMTFIAATNHPLENVIQDTTGNRRFAEITSRDRIDFEGVNAIDYRALWDAVHQHDPAPIFPVLDLLREHQLATAHEDYYKLWIEEEDWHEIRMQAPGDVDRPTVVPRYDPGVGYSLEQLALRSERFRRRVGQPPLSAKIFGERLKQLGFEKRRMTFKREDGTQSRPWRYFVPLSLAPSWVDGSTKIADEAAIPPQQAEAEQPSDDDEDLPF